jgi:hypothetical protein
LAEAQKANDLEPYNYLRYLFEMSPFATIVEDFSALLPTNLKAENLVLGSGATGV